MALFRDLPHAVSSSLSTLASTLSGWRGTMRRATAEVPDELLELYEFEGCPYCRLVREVLCEVQMDVIIYPCPSGGTRFRPKARELAGGNTTFPFLVDPNRDVALPESRDIVEYVYEHYTDVDPTRPGTLSVIRASLASMARMGQGTRARPSRLPDATLELWSFEGSPFSRIVRETLCELELPYVLRQVPKEQFGDIGTDDLRFGGHDWEPVEGGRREELIELGGTAQVPFLVDPNTGTQMYESADIVDYLEETYAL
ncbi:MAG: glutathione S-transferase N-terminal domain-containing protein [Myxococcota bacterium]